MERATLFLLGIGLLIVWVVGLALRTAGWIVWLDGIAGLCSLLIAAASLSGIERVTGASQWSLTLAFILTVLWLIALSGPTARWIAWTTFGFAVAFLAAGLVFRGRDLGVPRAMTRI